MTTKIKICGITNENDVLMLNKYRPDYCGFVFAESRRKVAADAAGSLASGLDPSIKRVGVFVDMDTDTLIRIAETVGLDVVQLHGNESQAYIDGLRGRLGANIGIWKAVRIAGRDSVEAMAHYKADRLLADAHGKEAAGGTGRRFDWRLLQGTDSGRIMLAGGLYPGNVVEAISTVKPYGVDVSSGVETGGRKDEELVKEFIYRVREKDGSNGYG